MSISSYNVSYFTWFLRLEGREESEKLEFFLTDISYFK